MSPILHIMGCQIPMTTDTEETLRPLPVAEETKWLRHPRDLLILRPQGSTVTPFIHDLMVAFITAYARMLALREPGARLKLAGYGCSASTLGSPISVMDSSEIEGTLVKREGDDPVYLPTALDMATCLADTLLSPYHVVLLANQVGTHPRRTINEAAQLKRQAVVDCVGIGVEESVDPKRVLRHVASTNADESKRVSWVTTSQEIIRHAEFLAGPIDLRSRAQRTIQSHARKGRP